MDTPDLPAYSIASCNAFRLTGSFHHCLKEFVQSMLAAAQMPPGTMQFVKNTSDDGDHRVAAIEAKVDKLMRLFGLDEDDDDVDRLAG